MYDPLLIKLLDALNLAVFEHIKDRSFKLLSYKTAWLSYLFPDIADADNIARLDELDYLGNFITDAIAFWQSGSSAKLNSGIWSEVVPSGEAHWFESSALNLDAKRILIVKTHGCEFTTAQMREQAAKDNLLAFEDLFRTEKDLEKYSNLLEEEVNKRTADLRERVKELNCLYNISRMIGEKTISLDTIFRDVVNLIPGGFQYPEITCAQLQIGDNLYATPNWLETSSKLSNTIVINDNEIGHLEVCYIEEKPERDEGPFLREERIMLAAICERLGRVIARYAAEKAAKESQEKLQQSYKVLNKTFDDTILAFSTIVEIKDRYTAGHQIRVARLAETIAKEMHLDDEQIRITRIAGLIHDIGKIYVPADILSRPGRLSDLEFEIIRTHAQYGYDILKTIDFPWPIAQVVLQHHEKLDGSGYPNGIKGEDILLYSRILTVADVVEAMASHRPYRSALGSDKALEEISQNKGKLYDPDAVDACLKLFTEEGFKFEE